MSLSFRRSIIGPSACGVVGRGCDWKVSRSHGDLGVHPPCRACDRTIFEGTYHARSIDPIQGSLREPCTEARVACQLEEGAGGKGTPGMDGCTVLQRRSANRRSISSLRGNLLLRLGKPSVTGNLVMKVFVRDPSRSNCSQQHPFASLLHANQSELSEGPPLHDLKWIKRSTRCILLLTNGSLAAILRPLER